MKRAELEESSESLLEPLNQADKLINQGKMEEAMEGRNEREKEGGLEELTWRLVESRCWNRKGELEHALKITDKIMKELEEIEESEEQKGERVKRIKIDSLIEQAYAQRRLGRLEEGLRTGDEPYRDLGNGSVHRKEDRGHRFRTLRSDRGG